MYELFVPIIPEVVIPLVHCGDRDLLKKQAWATAELICDRLELTLTRVVCDHLDNHCRAIIENAEGRRVVGTGDCFETAVASAEIIE